MNTGTIVQTTGTTSLELVANARANGIDFKWVGCDGFYGSSSWVLRELDNSGELFVADVHRDQVIYLEDPDPYVPEGKPSRGRKPRKLRARVKGIRVDSAGRHRERGAKTATNTAPKAAGIHQHSLQKAS